MENYNTLPFSNMGASSLVTPFVSVFYIVVTEMQTTGNHNRIRIFIDILFMTIVQVENEMPSSKNYFSLRKYKLSA